MKGLSLYHAELTPDREVSRARRPLPVSSRASAAEAVLVGAHRRQQAAASFRCSACRLPWPAGRRWTAVPYIDPLARIIREEADFGRDTNAPAW
jgi:hypothetical protein